MLVLQLAIATPLRRLFDYLAPFDLDESSTGSIQPGCRVAVNFRHRSTIGIVIALSDHSAVPPHKLKHADSIIDNSPIISLDMLAFYRWAADYYQHPLGDVLQNALPILLRQGQAAIGNSETQWRLSNHGQSTEAEQLGKQAKKQRALFTQLKQLMRTTQQISMTSAQLKAQGYSTAIAKGLEEKGLIERFESVQTWPPNPFEQPINSDAKLPTLNTEQQQALDSISNGNGFHCVLLAGVTGSGKTEVYFQAIKKVLQQGRQALLLIPEIGLSPQTISRIRSRFSVNIVTLHSGLSDSERLHAWIAARDGDAAIIVGTRSAIFTPIPKLGIIIVDEEHDSSYKQQDSFRYSARDLAVVRSKREDIPIILGSATPSIETLYNVQRSRYGIAKLTQRAGEASPPSYKLQDIRQKTLDEGFSSETLEAIHTRLSTNQQVLVFINRRGFAPVLMCHDCGWNAQCTHCDARMTVHMRPPHLHCHHCDQRHNLPKHCPHCRSANVQYIGQGTERSEEALKRLFPQYEVIRIDRDTTSRKHAMAELLDKINTGKACILVNTQMLAKGHHFPNIGLVVVIDADGGLFSADFRGPERMGQMLTQVAGRAGRATIRGDVIIQTRHPNDPLLLQLVHKNYFYFAESLMVERKLAQLPPYAPMALLRADSTDPQQPEHFLQQARQTAASFAIEGVILLGPLPSPMPKRAGRFRAQLLIQADTRAHLHQLLTPLTHTLETAPAKKQTRWSIDIDPQDMF